jgi:hypothetical protein
MLRADVVPFQRLGVDLVEGILAADGLVDDRLAVGREVALARLFETVGHLADVAEKLRFDRRLFAAQAGGRKQQTTGEKYNGQESVQQGFHSNSHDRQVPGWEESAGRTAIIRTGESARTFDESFTS